MKGPMINQNLVIAILIGVFVGFLVSDGAEALSNPMPELTDSPVVECTTTPTLIAPSTTAVGSICVQNENATEVYLGGKTVTTTTGLVLPAGAAGEPSTLCFDAQRTYCIVSSGTHDVRVGYGLRQ